ncbi:MAG: hypothetical protein JSV35_08265 [Candidatus Bathyarchaeota archaeon]|nr:MAG: hypothetical protein JSV35_08265 [Candidatus Bathyarchaeota archaeon]
MRFPAAAALLALIAWGLLTVISFFIELENKGFLILTASYLLVASIVLGLAALLEKKLLEIG